MITEEELAADCNATIITITGVERGLELYLCNNHDDPVLEKLVLSRLRRLIGGVNQFDNLTERGEE
jgi:hypothetical protein